MNQRRIYLLGLIIALLLLPAAAAAAGDAYIAGTADSTKEYKQLYIKTVDVLDPLDVSKTKVTLRSTETGDLKAFEYPLFGNITRKLEPASGTYHGVSMVANAPNKIIDGHTIPREYRVYIKSTLPSFTVNVPEKSGNVLLVKVPESIPEGATFTELFKAAAKEGYLFKNDAIIYMNQTGITGYGAIDSKDYNKDDLNFTLKKNEVSLTGFTTNSSLVRNMMDARPYTRPAAGEYLITAIQYDSTAETMHILAAMPVTILDEDKAITSSKSQDITVSCNGANKIAYILIKEGQKYDLSMKVNTTELAKQPIPVSTADLVEMLKTIAGDATPVSYTLTPPGSPAPTGKGFAIADGYGCSGYANASSVTITAETLKTLKPGAYSLYALGLENNKIIAIDQTRIDIATPRVANFTITPLSGKAPLEVRFTDSSTGNPVTWQWDFGDGRAATTKNPINTYQKAGNYTVTLTVTYSDKTTQIVTKSVVVERPDPVARFVADRTKGDAPLKVIFNDTSLGEPANYSWSFGDGVTSDKQNPVHTYTKAGTHTVKLTVERGGSSNATEQTITVNPVARFTANTTRGNMPLTVEFNATASTGEPGTYSWEFGDGSSSTDKVVAHKYETAGIYKVSLKVTGGGLTATETKDAFITVVDPGLSPAAEFRANITEGYADLAVQFTDQSQGDVTKWQWDFGDRVTSSDQNPVHTYTTPGTYTVKLTASKDGAQSSTRTRSGYITVIDPRPTAAFTASTYRGESPLTVQFTDNSTGAPAETWLWEFGGGDTSVLQNPVHVFDFIGEGAKVYTVKLTVTNSHGSATTTKEITVVSPPRKEYVGDRINSTARAEEDISLTYPDFELEIPMGHEARDASGNPIKNLSVGVAPTLEKPPAGTIEIGGKAFKLGPEGAQFNPAIPITITFTADEWAKLFGGGRNTILQRWDGTRWIELTNQTKDEATHTLTGYTNSFSTFAPITTTITPEPTSSGGGGGGGGGGSGIFPPEPTITHQETGSLNTNSAGIVSRSIEITAKDGVANLFVPSGVKALDRDGKPLNEISIKPLAAERMPAVPAGALFQFAGYTYEASPDGATFDPAITLTLEIPEDVWNTLDLTGRQLTVKWYNKETGLWEDVQTTVSPGTRTVRATITHFSTYALFTEPVTTTTPTGTATATVTTTTTAPGGETPAEGLPTMVIIFAVIVIIIAAAAVYLFVVKKD